MEFRFRSRRPPPIFPFMSWLGPRWSCGEGQSWDGEGAKAPRTGRHALRVPQLTTPRLARFIITPLRTQNVTTWLTQKRRCSWNYLYFGQSQVWKPPFGRLLAPLAHSFEDGGSRIGPGFNLLPHWTTNKARCRLLTDKRMTPQDWTSRNKITPWYYMICDSAICVLC